MDEPAFGVGSRFVSGVVVVDVAGPVDSASAPTLEQELRVSLASHPELLIVDLSDVIFLASAGLGVLMMAHDLAETLSSQLRVVVGDAVTSRPIRLTGLDSVLELYGSLSAALAA